VTELSAASEAKLADALSSDDFDAAADLLCECRRLLRAAQLEVNAVQGDYARSSRKKLQVVK
jgi:hypothetical protein